MWPWGSFFDTTRLGAPGEQGAGERVRNNLEYFGANYLALGAGLTGVWAGLLGASVRGGVRRPGS